MAEVTAKRVAVVAVVVGALVGGLAAGAAASGGTASASSAKASVATAEVVRTDLTASTKLNGSIGYSGSYAVVAPTGTTPQQLTQDQQAVTQDSQSLAADQAAATDTANADQQAVTAAAGTPQLATAEANETRDHDQDQAKITADDTKLQGDQATLATAQTTAVNPGTTYTGLPQIGATITQGQAVYDVSNQPVPLLYGTVAAYRAFVPGMADGADVGQLNQDLITLGYGAGLTPGNHFSSATTAAIERWQTALGEPATGELLLGEVVFEPGPIRITSVTPTVGAPLGGGTSGGGTVLDATSTSPVVTVDLNVDQEYLVKPGDAVTIVLPDGTSTVGGHVQTVGDVATCPGGSGSGASASADQKPCSSSGGGSTTPTVTVTVTLDSTPPGATLDQAPVDVDVTSQRADNVLAVPVNALLALAGGGFAVQVVGPTGSRLVAVTTGLYSSTLVQISGQGIAVGTHVEVPSS